MANPAAALVANAAKLATAPGATISSFLRGLASIDAAGVKPAVTLPKEVAVTNEHRVALSRLADEVAKVDWPSERRQLTEAEEAQLAELLEIVKTAQGVVDDAKDSLRTALFNHLDVQAEASGAVNSFTPRDGKGFYLLPGEGKGFKREFRSGTPSADADKLAELVAEGALDKRDYLAATRATRVVDEGGFLKLVARKPHLLPLLRRAVRYTRSGSVSLKLG
jgi:hypothetical protein